MYGIPLLEIILKIETCVKLYNLVYFIAANKRDMFEIEEVDEQSATTFANVV